MQMRCQPTTSTDEIKSDRVPGFRMGDLTRRFPQQIPHSTAAAIFFRAAAGSEAWKAARGMSATNP